MEEVLIADVEANDFVRGARKIWCIAIGPADSEEVTLYSDHSPGAPSLAAAVARLKAAKRVVFHNGVGYDMHVVNRVFPGTITLEQMFDTLIMSKMCWPNTLASLKIWGERLGEYKDDYDLGFDDFHPEMLPYCEQDVRVLRKVYHKLVEKNEQWGPALDVEQRFGFVMALQHIHGFKLNLEKAQALEATLSDERFQIERELKKVFPPILIPKKGNEPKASTPKWCFKTRTWTGVTTFTPKRDDKKLGRVKGAPFTKIKLQEFNPGSGAQVAMRLSSARGWRPQKFTDTGAPCVDNDVLDDLRYDEAKPLQRHARVVKQLGQLSEGKNAWLKLEEQSYVHGTVNQLGTRTHRCSHNAPNMGQVDKKDLRMREVWEADSLDDLIRLVAEDIVAEQTGVEKDDLLLGCDAESLELRMLAHYLAKYDSGAYGKAVVEGHKDDETDPHSLMRKAIGLYLRDSAKTFIYAMIYGGGDAKLGLIIQDDAREAILKGIPGAVMPKGSKSALGKAARAKAEAGIVGLDKLVAGVKKAHRRKKKFRAFDGRTIESVSEHSALNTVLQSAGALVMKYALVIFHFEIAVEKGWVDPHSLRPLAFNYCANVHDEFQMSVRPHLAEEVGEAAAEAIRLAGVRLGVRCPLAGSYDIGTNWKETH